MVRKLLLVAGVLVPVFLFAMAVWPGCILHGRVLPNEASALLSLRTIHEAQVAYSQRHVDRGFAPNLEALNSEERLDSSLARSPKSGYIFTYEPGKQVHGAIHSYTITAVPEMVSSAGKVRFFSNESGEIHYNASGPADASSPILQ